MFLCTHNQARSQMAEGLLRYFGGDRFEVFSAGSEPAEELHPLAVAAMADLNVDISQQYPKHFNQYLDQTFDYVITTCDRINESCPTFPNDPEHIHWSFPDPVTFEGTRAEKADQMRKLALELTNRVRLLIALPTTAKVNSDF